MLILNLPFPPAKLNPNKRLHWAAKAKEARNYRTYCRVTAIQQGAEKLGIEGKLQITITIYPPDRRRRDADNMVSAFKSGQDGIADAIGIDDHLWLPTYKFGDPVKYGAVKVEIEENQ